MTIDLSKKNKKLSGNVTTLSRKLSTAQSDLEKMTKKFAKMEAERNEVQKQYDEL